MNKCGPLTAAPLKGTFIWLQGKGGYKLGFPTLPIPHCHVSVSCSLYLFSLSSLIWMLFLQFAISPFGFVCLTKWNPWFRGLLACVIRFFADVFSRRPFGFDALSANFNVATLVCSYFRFVIVLQSPGSSLLILLLSPFRELNVPR